MLCTLFYLNSVIYGQNIISQTIREYSLIEGNIYKQVDYSESLFQTGDILTTSSMATANYSHDLLSNSPDSIFKDSTTTPKPEVSFPNYADSLGRRSKAKPYIPPADMMKWKLMVTSFSLFTKENDRDYKFQTVYINSGIRVYYDYYYTIGVYANATSFGSKPGGFTMGMEKTIKHINLGICLMGGQALYVTDGFLSNEFLSYMITANVASKGFLCGIAYSPILGIGAQIGWGF